MSHFTWAMDNKFYHSKTCANYLETKNEIECDVSSAITASSLLPFLLNFILMILFLLQ